MKKFLSSFIYLMILSQCVFAENRNGKNPLRFTENKGQVADQFHKLRSDVLFSGQMDALNFHIRKDGVSYQLQRVDNWISEEDAFGNKRIRSEKISLYRVDVNWVNTNADVATRVEKASEGLNNYYQEHCPYGVFGVRSYEGIWLENVYNSIDLHYYGKNGNLKYDYVVAPGANYKNIQFQIEGAAVSLEANGTLLLRTPFGNILEEKPIAFQNGRELDANWQVDGNILSFEIESHDPNQELIIDPILRVWGTYYGGSGTEEAVSISVDKSGNVFTAGFTDSNLGQTIATIGAHQTTFGTGTYDAYLVKMNSTGVRQWATYYGGSGIDQGFSCSVDPAGNIYLAGSTTSTNSAVMTGNGGHQSVYGAPGRDAFLVKFNTSGVRQWGTYYGGSGVETGHSCATDANGNIYMSGLTSTSATNQAIATNGAYQTTFGGGPDDQFLVKFNSTGVRQWGTYYGNNDDALVTTCATDPSGNVFVGSSSSTTLNTLASNGSHQPSPGGGQFDGTLVKFNSNGVRQWATYYGGGGADYVHTICTDISGNVFIAGNTTGSTGDSIATPGSHQPLYAGGYDVYLVKFDASGVRKWGTFYGGSGSEHVRGSIADSVGNVYIAGYGSAAGTVISSSGTYQDLCGGNFDAYIVKFNSNGVRQWGTFYGDAADDTGEACALDGSGGYFYLAGISETNSGTVIATNTSHQPSNGGGLQDGFIVKFRNCPPLVYGGPNPLNFCEGDLAIFSLNPPASVTQTLAGPGGFTSTLVTSDISNVQQSNAGTYTLTLSDATGCKESSNITVNVSVCTGIESLAISDGVKIYPNPTTGALTTELLKAERIEIINLTGQKVLEVQAGKGKNQLNISSFPSGIYVVKAGHKSYRIVKD
ncbi:MAG: SBBP repeat-containing protein [Bacteroidia bacterium]|nr:SBBP repeat-containing protein [Bacteroidia bacterium]